MKLNKLWLIVIIIILSVNAFAQLDETIINDEGQNNQTDTPQLRTLQIVTALNQKITDSATKSEINENFQQLDKRIQDIQLQQVSFMLIVVLINDVAIFSGYFLLKGRGLI